MVMRRVLVSPPPFCVMVIGTVKVFPADAMMNPGVGEKLVFGVTVPIVNVGAASTGAAFNARAPVMTMTAATIARRTIWGIATIIDPSRR
jgi:hypothetical protein